MVQSCDILIIGGGIQGLWIAKKALDAGMRVVLVDQQKCGSGASGGFLGALLPHLPNSMNHKNRFQYDALVDLEDIINQLEDDTGVKTGYTRCGRLMPIRHNGFLQTAELCKRASAQNWEGFSFDVIEVDRFCNWLNADKAPLGVAWDNLSAKVMPQLYIEALKVFVSSHGTVIEGFEFSHFDKATGSVYSSHGEMVLSEHIVISAGYRSYKIIEDLVGIDFGTGVKGHAALFSVDLKEQFPVLYDDGMYVVQHAPDKCAVGSTSEVEWENESEIREEKTRKFVQKARDLCLPLKYAECIGLWAGVRPKSLAKDPIVGQLCSTRNLWTVTGGFKISFGIAHRLAEYIVASIQDIKDNSIILPDTYTVEHHLKCGIETGRIHENTLSI